MENPCDNCYLHNPYTNTCYGLFTQEKTWEDAKQFCEDRGEHLVTFPSAESSIWFRQKGEELGKKNWL